MCSTSASISDSVVVSEMLIRMEQSASLGERPKAVRALLGVVEWDEQADPLDTYIPSPDR